MPVLFHYEKDTPGTHRYQEKTPEGNTPKEVSVGTLYLKKAFVKACFGEPPRKLQVEIKEVK